MASGSVGRLKRRRVKRSSSRRSRWVTINMGASRWSCRCRCSSNIMIIILYMYEKGMGKVVAARSHFRALDSNKYLDTKGMFKTTLSTSSGATKETWVYVVAGARPEPLLGDHNARTWASSASTPGVGTRTMTARLRKAGKKVITESPPCTGSQTGAGRRPRR